MKQKYFLISALLVAVTFLKVQAGEQNVTGITVTGLFPHFKTQPNNGAAVSSRLVAKVYLKHNSGLFIPVDSITYKYFSGDRGGFTSKENINSDEGILFDESYTYLYNAATSAYQNRLLRFQEYNFDNKVLKLTYTGWRPQQGGWKDSARYIYKYETGVMKSTAFQIWMGGLWSDHVLSDLVYDANNNVTEMNSTSYVAKFSYDGNNNLISMVDSQWSSTTGWTYNQRKTYSYTGNDVATYTLERWDGVAAQWVKSSYYEYTYSGTDMTSATMSSWNGSSWEKSVKHAYTYDKDHNKIEDITLIWNTASGSFVNDQREYITYNVHNQPQKLITQTWTGSSWGFTNDDEEIRFYYEYYFPTGIENVTSTESALQLYPSPAVNDINVSVSVREAQPATFTIYDMKGSIQSQWQVPNVSGNYKVNIPVSAMPGGAYVLQMTGSKEQLSARFLISR